MALQIFAAAPVEQSWHISRISRGQGKHWVMQGCTFLLLPRRTRNKGHCCRKSRHKAPRNSSLPLYFLELVGTQAQAKAVLRLFLFKSHISKEKCFNPLHLMEGQGWNSAGKHDLSHLSLFDSQSPSIRQLAGSNHWKLLLTPSVHLHPLIVRSSACGCLFKSIPFCTNQSSFSYYHYALIPIPFWTVPACCPV